VQNATYDEAIIMFKLKRKAAKEAVARIIEAYGTVGQPIPGLDVLLSYFSNMVYGLELLMKVMSQDWGADGLQKSASGHDVGKMYGIIFKRPYTKSDLMKRLQCAILDQKFLYEPDGGLKDRVPELEALWDELEREFNTSRWGKTYTVFKAIDMSKEFGDYLGQNVERFVTGGPYSFLDKEHAVQTLEFEILVRQRRLDAMKQSPEPTEQEVFAMTEKAYTEKLADIRRNLGALLVYRKGVLRFGKYEAGAVAGQPLG
jgi:hypothetical protein